MSSAASLLQPVDNRFLARADVLAKVVALLRAGRSVVIVGPPGVGKTRLAAECLSQISEETVSVVKLSDICDKQNFIARIGEALGIFRTPTLTEASAESRILRALSARGPEVLVLDNFEQLSPEVDSMLQTWMMASAVTFLVTSRRGVACAAETVALRPLSVSAAGSRWSEAAELIRVRAHEGSRMRLLDDDREAIHELAVRLDGLPLAIELAAARLSILTPTQLLARLDQRFRALDGQGDGAGLAAALQTSYALLDIDARACLLACAAFRGGIRLDALEFVFGPDRDVLSTLTTLRSQSLLTVERVGRNFRYSLAQSIRDFVLERDGGGDPWRQARDRHAEFWCSTALQPIELTNEVDNLRYALEWAIEDDLAQAARLALMLSAPELGLPYLLADSILTSVVDRDTSGLSEELSAELLLRRGTVRRFLADCPGAFADLERAQMQAERCNNAQLLAEVLAGLGNAHYGTADWGTSREFLRRALAIHPSSSFRAIGLSMIANTYSNEDDFDRAEPLLRDAIRVAESPNDPFAEAFARLSLGILLVERGALDEAFVCLLDSLATLETNTSVRVMQARHLRAIALTHIARVKQEAGDKTGALSDYHEALAFAEEAGVQRAEAFALHGLASVLLELGELRAADDRIRAALPLMRQAAKDAEGALVALQGVLFALRGAHEDAERFFRRAEVLLKAHKRPVFLVALRILRDGDTDVSDSPFAQFADVLLARRLRALFSVKRRADPVFVAHDGSFFRLPGSNDAVHLGRRKALRGILRALVHARVERPGIPVSVESLVSAGWPGEKIRPAAAAERVYAAVATLRRLGLRGIVVQDGEGYLVPSEMPVVVHEANG